MGSASFLHILLKYFKSLNITCHKKPGITTAGFYELISKGGLVASTSFVRLEKACKLKRNEQPKHELSFYLKLNAAV